MSDNDDKLISRIVQVLDQSLEEVDASTLKSLSRLKYQAMDSAVGKRKRRVLGWSFAATAVALSVGLFFTPSDQLQQIPRSSSAELGILTATEPLEFFTEDVEFYEWLSEVMENNPVLLDLSPAEPAAGRSGHSAGTGGAGREFAQS